MSRPTKCTPELTALIAADVAAGTPGEVAAEAHGLGRSTFYSWLKWGRRREPGFVEFRDAIKRAQAQAETQCVGIVRQAALKSWQAAAWWLERRAPKRWGRWGTSPAPERAKPASERYAKMTEEEMLEEFKRAMAELEEAIAQKQDSNASVPRTPSAN